MTSRVELGAFIADRRASRNLSSEELAREAGVDVPTVERWESGAAVPSDAQLARLSHALQVHMEELFSLAGRPTPAADGEPGPTGFTP